MAETLFIVLGVIFGLSIGFFPPIKKFTANMISSAKKAALLCTVPTKATKSYTPQKKW